MVNILSIKSLNNVWSKSGRQFFTMNWGPAAEKMITVYIDTTDSGLYKM